MLRNGQTEPDASDASAQFGYHVRGDHYCFFQAMRSFTHGLIKNKSLPELILRMRIYVYVLLYILCQYVFQWLRIDNGIICLVFFGKGTHFIPLRHIQPVLFISKQMINFFVIYFYFFLCFLLLYVSSTRTQSFREHIHITGRFISGTNTKKNKSKSRRGSYKD